MNKETFISTVVFIAANSASDGYNEATAEHMAGLLWEKLSSKLTETNKEACNCIKNWGGDEGTEHCPKCDSQNFGIDDYETNSCSCDDCGAVFQRCDAVYKQII